jgi:DnaJ-domain-containing protein 1
MKKFVRKLSRHDPAYRAPRRSRRPPMTKAESAHVDERIQKWAAERAKHCATLGVRLFASSAEIKSRFRALALKFHPDRNPTGEEQMKAINAAYRALVN